MNRQKIGFSTGAVSRELCPREAVKITSALGCSAVELNFGDLKRLESGGLKEIRREDLDDFNYVSLHAPPYPYASTKESLAILQHIKDFHNNVRPLDLVVIHPDQVVDFSFLASSGLPMALENMDKNKSFRYPADFLPIFSQYPQLAFVLDVNHVFTNDPSMALVGDFLTAFGDRVAQVHISGYKDLHEPLFETKQQFILDAVKNLNVPIIIESMINESLLEKEWKFVQNGLTK